MRTMKVLAVLMLMLAMACSCHPTKLVIRHDGFGGTNGDSEAAAIQNLMASAVHLNHHVMVVPREPPKKGETPHIPKDVGPVGSGVVVHVDVKNNRSVILTAGHLCAYMLDYGEAGVFQSESFTVTNPWGGKLPGKAVRGTLAPDVCVIEADGIAGVPAEQTFEDPPIGARLSAVGYPEGLIFDRGVSVVEGVLFGWDKQPLNGNAYFITSLPVIGGHSGSGVFYKGKLIGIVHGVRTEFHHTSYIVPMSEIKKYLDTPEPEAKDGG